MVSVTDTFTLCNCIRKDHDCHPTHLPDCLHLNVTKHHRIQLTLVLLTCSCTFPSVSIQRWWIPQITYTGKDPFPSATYHLLPHHPRALPRVLPQLGYEVCVTGTNKLNINDCTIWAVCRTLRCVYSYWLSSYLLTRLPLRKYLLRT